MQPHSIHRIAAILAFLTGLMFFLPFAAAALFAGFTSPFAIITWFIAGAWTICALAPVFYLHSRKTVIPALAASSVVVLLSAYEILYSFTHQVFDPLYFTSPIPVGAYLAIPLASNAVHLALSISRSQQLSSVR